MKLLNGFLLLICVICTIPASAQFITYSLEYTLDQDVPSFGSIPESEAGDVWTYTFEVREQYADPMYMWPNSGRTIQDASPGRGYLPPTSTSRPSFDMWDRFGYPISLSRSSSFLEIDETLTLPVNFGHWHMIWDQFGELTDSSFDLLEPTSIFDGYIHYSNNNPDPYWNGMSFSSRGSSDVYTAAFTSISATNNSTTVGEPNSGIIFGLGFMLYILKRRFKAS